MASDVTRDELEAALAATGLIVEEARLLHIADGPVFLAAVRYPGAVAEELLAHIEAGRKAVSR
jgi:hypothetical protein